MTAAPAPCGDLLGRLPAVRGRYSANADLARIAWFRVGGPADVSFRPRDVDDLAGFLRARPAGLPVTVIGVASNLLIRDGGIAGVVVRLGRGFAGIEPVPGAPRIRCGAAALDVNVAEVACAAGIAGLEFLTGVPGTIGGALRMNAGAFGSEIKDVLVSAEALAPDGERRVFSAAELGLAYRACALPDDWIFTAAELAGAPEAPQRVRDRLEAIRREREATQPVRARTGGSTFKNPAVGAERAWELIERAGCRGLARGGARVSEKHCNFLVNRGDATAADLEALGEEVRRRVARATGVALEWEIHRVGRRPRGEADVAACGAAPAGERAS